MKTKKLSLIALFFFFLIITGCGNKKELDDYKIHMDSFYSRISEYDNLLNSIDAEAENSVEELLSTLDNMSEDFNEMAALTVPEQFSAIETLSAEAAEYMQNAVMLFHQAYESNPFDGETAATAKEYYDYANKCVIYMLSVLHGETSVQEDIITSNQKETVTDIEYTEDISEIGGSDVDTD